MEYDVGTHDMSDLNRWPHFFDWWILLSKEQDALGEEEDWAILGDEVDNDDDYDDDGYDDDDGERCMYETNEEDQCVQDQNILPHRDS